MRSFHARCSAALLAALACGGCAEQRDVFRRVDGQLTKGNPQLEQQFKLDGTVCQGELAKADAAAGDAPLLRRDRIATDVFRGCMASKGYVVDHVE